MAYCQHARTAPLPVLVRIDSEPYEDVYCVSITCAQCRHPLFVERTSEVTADELPMTLTMTTVVVDGQDEVRYELASRPDDDA